VLPRRSGRVVFEHIAAGAPRLPILVSSGYTADVFPESFFAERRVELIAKPYDAAELLSRIRCELDRSAGGTPAL
jgi:DNA-binding response OmpR family regulator